MNKKFNLKFNLMLTSNFDLAIPKLKLLESKILSVH